MASLFKQDGYYYLQFYDAARRPQRKRIALRVRDKRTAERLRIDRESAQMRGEYDPWTDAPAGGEEPDRAPKTLSEGTALLLREKEAEGKSPNTLRSYRAVLNLLEGRVGDVPLDALSARDLLAFVRDDSVSATTNRNRYRHVRAAVRWWQDRELCGGSESEDPLQGVTPPKASPRVPRAITAGELDAICEAVRESYAERVAKNHARTGEMVWRIPLFRFAFATGMRSGELARLRWGHVDSCKGVITIERQKNGKAQTIPLTSEAARILSVVRPGDGADYVFRSPRFDQRQRRTQRFVEAAAKAFRKARVRAGIERHLTVHSLRHGFCTRLAEAGLPAYVIKDAARHASVQTSMIYVALTTASLKDQLERALAPGGE